MQLSISFIIMSHYEYDFPFSPIHSRAGSRERKPTAAGKVWQVEQKRRALRRSIATWRQHSIQIEAMVTGGNLISLNSEVEALKIALKEVQNNSQQLELLDHDIFSEFEATLMELEDESYRLLKLWSGRVRQSDVHSVSGRRSRYSGYSGSSAGSDHSRKLELATKTAVLRAKLKYVELEAQKKAELAALVANRELEMAEAELVAMRLVEREEGECSSDSSEQTPYNTVFSHKVECHPSETPPPSSGNPVPVIQQTDIKHRGNPSHSSSDPVPGAHGAQIYPWGFPPPSSSETVPVIREADIHPRRTPLHSDPVPVVHGAVMHRSDETSVLIEQLRVSRLPIPEPDTFFGDPLKYSGWKSSFKALICHQNISDIEKMYYLKKFVGGDAKECIEGCFLINSNDAFQEAFATLDERFGDAYSIASAFRDKLDSWPRIVGNDGKGLQKFADYLQQCKFAMQTIDSLAVLNDDRENKKMLQKLPDWLVTRWARVVSTYKENNGIFPPFREFASFMKKEARIACDPVTSLQAVRPKDVKKSTRSSVRTSFLSDSKEVPGSSSVKMTSFTKDHKKDKHQASGRSTRVNVVSGCCLCKEKHELDSCPQFKKMTLDERQKYVLNNDICFKCLNVGHRSKECAKKKTCGVCTMTHPTSLHRYTTSDGVQPPTSVTPRFVHHLSGPENSHKASMIVPVWVSHVDRPAHEVCLYAMLDTQSDTTFVTEDALAYIGVSGTKAKLVISTMTDAGKVVDSQKISGLIVRGFRSDLKIQLPITYSRGEIPANRSHIPTAEMTKSWPYLDRLHKELPPLQDVAIGILIGYNCPRALAPREVIPPVQDGPYAQRTDLGWGIVGVVGQSLPDDAVVSHHIVSLEASPSLGQVPLHLASKIVPKRLYVN